MSSGTAPTYEILAGFISTSAGLVPSSDVLEISTERRVSDFLNRIEIGQCQVLLDNSRGQYTSGSTRARINHPLKVRAIYPNSTCNIFVGTIESVQASPSFEQGQTLLLSAADVSRNLRRPITTPFIEGTISSSLAAVVTSLAAINVNSVVIDPAMRDPVPFAYYAYAASGDAAATLQTSFLSYMHVNKDGQLVLTDRNFDINTPVAASLTAFYDFQLTEDLTTIINRADIITAPRKKSTDVATVAWIDNAIFIVTGETKSFRLDYVDPETEEGNTPVTNIQDVVPYVDYNFNTGTDNTGTDITSGCTVSVSAGALSAFVVIVNSSGSNGYLASFSLKGQAYSRAPSTTATAVNTTSVNSYGEVPFALESELLASGEYASGLANYLVSRYGEPSPTPTFVLKNEYPTILSLDLLDRVRLVNSVLNVNSTFLVKSVEHQIRIGAGVEHQVTYETFADFSKVFFIVSNSSFGRLNINRLGY